MNDYEKMKNLLKSIKIEFLEFKEEGVDEISLILTPTPSNNFQMEKFIYHKGIHCESDDEDLVTSFNFNSHGKFTYIHLGVIE